MNSTKFGYFFFYNIVIMVMDDSNIKKISFTST